MVAGVYRDGIYTQGPARIVDRAGQRRLPVGVDSFERLVERSCFIDKTMLVVDILDRGSAVMLYCRPRRFGKTLALSMLKSFFEIPLDGVSRAPLFEGTAIWEAREGSYRSHQGRYPVVAIWLNDVKKLSWQEAHGAIAQKVAFEYQRHAYLLQSPHLNEFERAHFAKVARGEAGSAALATSLMALTGYLHRHHGVPAVVLIDEYDAPVMAGYAHG